MALDFKDLAKVKWYYQVVIVAGVCGGVLALFWYEYLQDIQQQIQTKIDLMRSRLASFPHFRMAGSNNFRMRVGDYRIIYRFDLSRR